MGAGISAAECVGVAIPISLAGWHIHRMNIKVDINPEMQRRVAAIARRTGMSESQIVTEALEYGRSLDWQERFAAKIGEGIEAADRGEFASSADIQRIRSKYLPS